MAEPTTDATNDDLRALEQATHAYEDALAAGASAEAAAYFDDDPATSRFGPEGAQFDLESVRALRAATGPTPTAVWLHDSLRMLSPTIAIHRAVLERGGNIVQRTQVWIHRPAGWRIAHAHVSRTPPSP